jgi:hypothetical protein
MIKRGESRVIWFKRHHGSASVPALCVSFLEFLDKEYGEP